MYDVTQTPASPKPNHLDRVRNEIRARHYSRRTEKAYATADPVPAEATTFDSRNRPTSGFSRPRLAALAAAGEPSVRLAIHMAYIPEDAQWFLADVVLEHTIEDESRNVVHVNLLLIQACSPEEAFGKAVELGKNSEHEYRNTDNRLVRVRFRGLRELDVIHDDLEHGAELSYEEFVGVPGDKLQEWVIPKHNLAVFSPRQAKMQGPNSMPKSVMQSFKDAGFSEADLEEEQA